MIKKEHIGVVPYISREIEIYTTSGRWEVSELLTTLKSGWEVVSNLTIFTKLYG